MYVSVCEILQAQFSTLPIVQLSWNLYNDFSSDDDEVT